MSSAVFNAVLMVSVTVSSARHEDPNVLGAPPAQPSRKLVDIILKNVAVQLMIEEDPPDLMIFLWRLMVHRGLLAVGILMWCFVVHVDLIISKRGPWIVTENIRGPQKTHGMAVRNFREPRSATSLE